MKVKNIDKIIKESEFIVQEKTGGWKGFNLYVRHPLWVKFSCESITTKKPILNDALKKKIVELALENKRIEEHNHPLYFEREKFDSEWRSCLDHISHTLWSKPETMDKILDLLMFECEDVGLNIVFQRITEMKDARNSVSNIEKRKIPKVSRIIAGKKEE